jgi:hypothetical protein
LNKNEEENSILERALMLIHETSKMKEARAYPKRRSNRNSASPDLKYFQEIQEVRRDILKGIGPQAPWSGSAAW